MVVGCVLAGGHSRRMMTDKAFMPVDGQPLAQRTGQRLLDAGCSPVYLVGRQPRLPDLGFPVIAEPKGPHRHPLFAVAHALETLQCKVLFAPCDLVDIDVESLQKLLNSTHPCAASHQALLCVLTPEIAPLARDLADLSKPARLLAETLPRVDVPLSALTNLNSPQDLQSRRASQTDGRP